MVTRYRVETNHPTQRLNLHVSSVSPLPKSYHDVFNDPNWQNAMCDKYNALIKNKTWTLVPRPTDTNIVRCMWLFRHKYLANGTLSRYKTRLLANGSTQLEGVDVDETFSPCKYAIEILERASMVSCNPCRTPVDTESKLGDDGDPDPTFYRSLAGSLQYLTFTRPSIFYAVQQICLYMHDPQEPHFSALKRILRYVRGTLDYGLQLFSSSTTDLVAYSDADWARCPTNRRSTSEEEYRGVANAVAETCWLRNLLRELHTPLSSSTLVYCEYLVVVGEVRVLHVPYRYQYADIFTKGLPSALFEEFRSSLSFRCPPAPTAGELTDNYRWLNPAPLPPKIYPSTIWTVRASRSTSASEEGDTVFDANSSSFYQGGEEASIQKKEQEVKKRQICGSSSQKSRAARAWYFILGVEKSAEQIDADKSLVGEYGKDDLKGDAKFGQHMKTGEAISNFAKSKSLSGQCQYCALFYVRDDLLHAIVAFGEHAVHCKELPGFKYRHDLVRDVLYDVLKRTGISSRKEAPVNFLTDPLEGRSTLRPADILVFGWAGGKHACVDLTGVSPLVGLRDNGFVAGQAALKAESSKVAKHEKACLENQHVFIPFAFDTFGFLAPEAEEFLNRVQRVVQSNFSTPKTQNFIFSRIGFAIQKGVAAQLVARLPAILL
ncbi:ribonuclease H-like domain-containing protein [Tanacetum coccineum]